MNKRYRLGEIEEAVSEMEELIGLEDDIAEIDDDFQIVVSGWSVYVESMNLTLRQGIACVWDAEEGLFMPDFDVREGSNIKGLARIYFENSFIVNNINIVQGKEKIFVSMRYTTGMSENCKKRAGHHNSIPSKNSLIETLKICARARSSDTLIL